MKTNSRVTTTTRAKRADKPAALPPTQHASKEDYQQFAENSELQVEHQTVPGFLRRIAHRWHMDDLIKFGQKVGRTADSMQLAWIATVDPHLGQIRMFPVPLLQRVYQVMAPTQGWPSIIEAAALEDARADEAETLRKVAKAEKQLRELRDITERADDVTVLESVETLRRFLEADLARMQLELQQPAAVPAPVQVA